MRLSGKHFKINAIGLNLARYIILSAMKHGARIDKVSTGIQTKRSQYYLCHQTSVLLGSKKGEGELVKSGNYVPPESQICLILTL